MANEEFLFKISLSKNDKEVNYLYMVGRSFNEVFEEANKFLKKENFYFYTDSRGSGLLHIKMVAGPDTQNLCKKVLIFKSNEVIQLEHHGAEVFVKNNLKGTHREYCLCFSGCKKFKPGEEDNCLRAKELYKFCVTYNMVTPVFECPEYESTK